MIMRRMSLSAPSVWWPRLAAWVLSALVAASAVAWGLRIGGGSGADAVAPAVANTPLPDDAAVARALGAAGAERPPAGTSTVAAPMLESSRFVLLGVLDPGHAHGLASRLSSGTALVAVDGQSAKPVAVGAVLVDGWTLQSVQGRSAVLERQGSRITLELPSLPAPAGFELKGKNGP
jgi:general secretion pathway protein C